MEIKDIIFIFLVIFFIYSLLNWIINFIIRHLKKKNISINKKGIHYKFGKTPVTNSSFYKHIENNSLLKDYLNYYYLDIIKDQNAGYYAIVSLIYTELQTYDSFIRNNFFSNDLTKKLSQKEKEYINTIQNKIKEIIDTNLDFRNLSYKELEIIIEYIKICIHNYYNFILEEKEKQYFSNDFEEKSLYNLKNNHPLNESYIKIISVMLKININLITILENNDTKFEFISCNYFFANTITILKYEDTKYIKNLYYSLFSK